jgi:hypothetical protein
MVEPNNENVKIIIIDFVNQEYNNLSNEYPNVEYLFINIFPLNLSFMDNINLNNLPITLKEVRINNVITTEQINESVRNYIKLPFGCELIFEPSDIPIFNINKNNLNFKFYRNISIDETVYLGDPLRYIKTITLEKRSYRKIFKNVITLAKYKKAHI